jgi:hypothetical protein
LFKPGRRRDFGFFFLSGFSVVATVIVVDLIDLATFGELSNGRPHPSRLAEFGGKHHFFSFLTLPPLRKAGAVGGPADGAIPAGGGCIGRFGIGIGIVLGLPPLAIVILLWVGVN